MSLSLFSPLVISQLWTHLSSVIFSLLASLGPGTRQQCLSQAQKPRAPSLCMITHWVTCVSFTNP